MPNFMRRITALGRPLEPDWPSNRAVMVLMPVGALIAWGRAALGGGFASPLVVAALGAMTVLLTWALGRELAPDRHGAAFVAMALGFAVFLWEPRVSLLLAATALVLSRVVNRTTGLPATPFDTLAALGLVAWALTEGAGPGPGLAAALAFGLDAALPPAPGRADAVAGSGPEAERTTVRHGLAAAGALALAAWAALGAAAPFVAAPEPGWAVPSTVGLLVAAVVLVAAARVVLGTRDVRSRGDDTDLPLSAARVRGGIVVVAAVGLGALLQGDAGIHAAGLIWAALAGVALWRPSPQPI